MTTAQFCQFVAPSLYFQGPGALGEPSATTAALGRRYLVADPRADAISALGPWRRFRQRGRGYRMCCLPSGDDAECAFIRNIGLPVALVAFRLSTMIDAEVELLADRALSTVQQCAIICGRCPQATSPPASGVLRNFNESAPLDALLFVPSVRSRPQ